MPQLFKNNVSGVLASQLLSGGSSMTLVDASAFPAPGSDYYLATLIGLNGNGQEASWEIVRVTAKAGSTLTITRAQEGTAAATWPAATRVEMRLTAASMDGKEPTVTAGTTAQYWRGDKTWRDFFTDVRAATLTGLSTATNAVISAADTVLGALGKLQAQVSAKQDTLVSGTSIKTVNGVSLLGSGDMAVGSGDVTQAGVQTLTNKTISGGVYSGVVDQTGSVRNGIVSVVALDIDCSLGNYFSKTVSGNSTFTFSSPPTSRAYSFTLRIGLISGAITWPGSVRWPGNTAPQLVLGNHHLFRFETDSAGATWRGRLLGDFTG